MDVYVINMDKDKEKWQLLQERFGGWSIQRIAGVDGSKCRDRPFHMNGKMHSCLQSHRKAWSKVVENNRPALIMEDDCVPTCDDIEAEFARMVGTLPSDYDVAVFGYMTSDVSRDYLIAAFAAPLFKRRCMRKVNEDWYVPGFFTGSHCYMVSPKGAGKLLDDKTMYHADYIICRNKQIQLYCAKEALVTQELPGRLYYNKHLTWEWVMMECIVAVGRMTIRVCHAVVFSVVVVLMLFLSQSIVARTVAKLILFYIFCHYVSTITHITHNHTHGKTIPDIQYDKKEKWMVALNDACALLTIIVLCVVAYRRRVLVPVIDLLIVAYLLRVVIVYTMPMKDPSGVCEERSVGKHSFMEYCGSLRVSGHIMASVFLFCLSPRLGLGFFLAQSTLIFMSRSHYAGDVVLGVLVMVSVLALFGRKLLQKPDFFKNKKKM